jgi:hypothetical protein
MAQLSLSSSSLNAPRRRASRSPQIIRHGLLSLLPEVLRAIDVASVPLCGLVAYHLRWKSLAIGFDLGVLLLLGMVVIANVMAAMDVYALGHFGMFRTQLIKTVCGWSATISIVLVVLFFDKSSEQYSRIWVAYWLVLGASVSVIARLSIAAYLTRRRRAGSLSIKIAVVGTDAFAQHVARQISLEADIDVTVVGVFAPRLDANPVGIAADATVGGLMRLARKIQIDEVIIHLPENRGPEFASILWKLSELPVNVKLCPDLSDLPVPMVQQAVMINVSDRPFPGWSAVIKRAEDIVLSGLILFLLAPLMLFISLLVRLDSPGPVLFLQRRLGFNNNLFTVYKFRTMTAAASSDPSAPQAQRDDPRVTRIGRFLRKSSLEDLPNLINVLR